MSLPTECPTPAGVSRETPVSNPHSIVQGFVPARPFGGEQRTAIFRHLNESAEVKRQVAERCGDALIAASEAIAAAFRNGGKLLICGNGGSAADCQHMAAEFTSRLTMDFARPGLPAIALTVDSSFLTAYANDFDFAGVFARQVQALGKPGDLLLGLSTSGNSGNVVRAVETARALGLKTIVMTGAAGRLRELADVAICIPSTKTQYIQESHLACEHIICALVERSLYGEKGCSS
jgi:D-sedoheptulose 7-phosphate isomerase